ncbi:MAG TPA: DNA polymerase III subunit gamma/tau [bacterium]|nr:DNA polymerase III subunit gamma/tau [bacterium]HQG44696.1 DNA polymerase III subunit gamma/tau [bacterium]HQI47332.1 DNA polymerase III subunit gamma/tau [bacterium]HQJ63393.1 DNA polymerase III subunit gamma/tau [bacterium]
MSYLVLARKYRPMFFTDVMGQQHVTQTLQNAIQQNRIANAYLFCGPRGIGKTTVARLLAKALNCDQGPTIHPCNTCSSCIEINESRSLDVFEIDGASNRGIDEVRNLREGLRYTPNPGKYRIYIIDEVHMLTNEAFNALLKTLEEPPVRVLFIFATTEVHKVPATILSRCQRFDFKRMPHHTIVEQLQTMCRQEEITIDAESLRIIATKADGSMRDSQSILDQIIAFAGKNIQARDVASLLGIIDQELFFRVTDLIRNKDTEGAVKLAEYIFNEGFDFDEFLLGLEQHLRNFLVIKSSGAAHLIDCSEEHIARYQQEKEAFSVEDLLRLIKIAADTENLVRRSSNARLHFEVALVKMVRMSGSVQLAALMAHLNDEVKKNSSPSGLSGVTNLPDVSLHAAFHAAPPPSTASPVPASPPGAAPPLPAPSAPAPVPAAAASSSGLTLAFIEERWQSILDAIRAQKVALGTFLCDGWPTRVGNGQLEIMFPRESSFQMDAILNSRALLQEIIAAILGTSLNIVCVKDEEGLLPRVRKIAPLTDNKKEFEKLLQEDRWIQTVVQLFDAEFLK